MNTIRKASRILWIAIFLLLSIQTAYAQDGQPPKDFFDCLAQDRGITYCQSLFNAETELEPSAAGTIKGSLSVTQYIWRNNIKIIQITQNGTFVWNTVTKLVKVTAYTSSAKDLVTTDIFTVTKTGFNATFNYYDDYWSPDSTFQLNKSGTAVLCFNVDLSALGNYPESPNSGTYRHAPYSGGC